MGLFDIFKKKEKQPEEKNPKTYVQQEANGTVANNGREFTYVVEDVFQLRNDMGIVVVGNVHGCIREKDAVYIIQPGGQITLAEVSGLECRMQEGMRRVSEAADRPVSVHLAAIKNKQDISKWAVLTSIRPQPVVDVNTAVENPQVLAFLREYNHFSKDTEFLNILTYAIVHAHYLVPLYVDKEPTANGDGTSTFNEGANLGFLSIKDPEDPTKNIFPVFTDWRALGNWKNLYDEKHPPRTMILRFPDCVTFVKKGHNSLAINPFGSNTMVLSEALVEKITSLEGYKNEFEAKDANQDVHEHRIEKETKITVGVPADSEEVRFIYDALRAYGRQTPEVKEIYWLLKVDEKQERTYFGIVDCPKEKAREVFGQIYQAVKSYAVTIPIIDFALYEEAAYVRDVLERTEPVYRA